MFTNNRETMRLFFFDSWMKYQHKATLTALEQQVVDVIQKHPEYHVVFEHKQQALQQDYWPEMGETNPFLHMSMHLGLQDQITTNRPEGISTYYRAIVDKIGAHEAEHIMMECLAEALWSAQQSQTAPDDLVYIGCIKEKLQEIS